MSQKTSNLMTPPYEYIMAKFARKDNAISMDGLNKPTDHGQ